MKTFLAGVIALACAVMAACSTANLGTNPLQPVVQSTPADERAVYTLSNAGLAAERAFSAALRLGYLQPRAPLTVQIADVLVQVDAGIDAAEAAYEAGNAADLSAAVTRTRALIAQAQRLIPVAAPSAGGSASIGD